MSSLQPVNDGTTTTPARVATQPSGRDNEAPTPTSSTTQKTTTDETDTRSQTSEQGWGFGTPTAQQAQSKMANGSTEPEPAMEADMLTADTRAHIDTGIVKSDDNEQVMYHMCMYLDHFYI